MGFRAAPDPWVVSAGAMAPATAPVDFTVEATDDVALAAAGRMTLSSEGAESFDIDANGGDLRVQSNSGNLVLYAAAVMEVGDGLHFDGEAAANGPVGNVIGKVRVVTILGAAHGWIPVYDAVT